LAEYFQAGSLTVPSLLKQRPMPGYLSNPSQAAMIPAKIMVVARPSFGNPFGTAAKTLKIFDTPG